ncbi:protein FAR1-RELATED SEQUENCE 5-like [Dioscorea cayenensis subsp. rotundata]|uniref:Protein FAR1-RELATED SEQUENCE 5-like n=1 Tax=Dioscorea cayennensis subsp. rotundata TaxID=55577 RepID=A0AB40BIZ5_DIOCR|nr:protein FAR1-RELATED SEQUENCE 5-like [Dioscorea cayenensis subsp. rotundata]XP_039127228.1 protein FAR1-RELATED SEQUENCE 5-like [Dioscorea cayenensis subsp. rotundata]
MTDITDEICKDDTLIFEDMEIDPNELELSQHQEDGGSQQLLHGQELAKSPQSQDEQKSERIPFVGMEFHDEEEAYRFYLDYAKSRGFGIRRGHMYRLSHSQLITCRHFVCDKEGSKCMKDKRQQEKIVHRRKDTRTNCQSRMVVSKMKSGLWTIKTFGDAHNHDLLTSPSKVMKMRSHHHISDICKSLMEALHKSRVGPSQMSRILNETLSDTGCAQITREDCSNHLRAVRSNNIGQECMAIVKYFKEKKLNDDFFFFDMELDEFGQTRSVFWADGRCRIAYSEFGDVVFDTTYQTNRFCFPFAPFVGVNHHKQSILFGCALIADEKEESFLWVFETWMKCMLGKHPQTIITDQDLAMGKAIAKVFPNSGHRLCSWHIGRNSMKYLVDLKSKEGFLGDYNSWLHRSASIEAFESKWGELKATYNIDDKHWLSKMYEIRHKWVFLYWQNIFTAGMTSTQRSESINSFFDGFVNSQTPLDEFVMQYDKALCARRNDEENEDFKTLNSMPNFHTGHPIERHAGEVYTRAVFNIFQAELRESDSMLAERIRDGTDHAKYKICNHIVIFRRDDLEDGEPIATCSCKKFETEGVLCCHILKIFKKKEVAKIPKNYILRRWSMVARNRSNVMMVDISNNAFTPLMKWNAQNMCFRIAQSISSLEMYEKIMPKLNDIFKIVGEFSFPATSGGDDVCGSHISILDPKRVKSKGRPKVNTRIKSGIDIQLSLQKKRTCSRCGRKGHYMSTCTFSLS